MLNRASLVAALAAVVPATPAISANLCETVGEKYRAVLDTSKPEMPQWVVRNLSRVASTGVTIGESLVENVDNAKLDAWAKAQTPPVTLSPDLLKQIADNTDARQDLDQLPGTNFYAVNGTAGTESCYQPGTYFQVENGQVKTADAPANWTDEGICRVIRSFGAIDGTPAVFQEGETEDGDVVLDITPWNGSGFDAACTATFKFDADKKLTDVTVK